MLNIFNRVVTVFFLLAVIACAALVAFGVFLPATLREQAAQQTNLLFATPTAWTTTEQAVTVGVAALVILLAFILLVFELRPAKRDEAIRVKMTDGGETAIARSAILKRLQYAIDTLDDVVQVTPTLKGKAKGLLVHLDVITSPHIDVPMKTEEIRAVTQDVIETQMGLVLKRVTVNIDHEEYRELFAEEPA